MSPALIPSIAMLEDVGAGDDVPAFLFGPPPEEHAASITPITTAVKRMGLIDENDSRRRRPLLSAGTIAPVRTPSDTAFRGKRIGSDRRLPVRSALIRPPERC